MNLNKLVEDLTGKSWTVTGPDKGQCTAVAHEWEKRCNSPIVYGNAKDTYANAGGEYEKTPNRPDNFPPGGAIVVWGGTWGGGYGHTAVALDGANTRTFKALSQNDPTGTNVQVKTYSYSGVTGWFVPKANKQGDEVMTDEQEKEAYRLVLGRERETGPTGRTAYQFLIDARAELGQQRVDRDQQLSGLSTQVKSQQTTIDVQTGQIRDLGTQLEVVRQELEQRPQSTPSQPSEQPTGSEAGQQTESPLPDPLNNTDNHTKPDSGNNVQKSNWLEGKKTYIGIAAGAVYSVLIALGYVESNELVWTAIGTYTGISFRLALKKEK